MAPSFRAVDIYMKVYMAHAVTYIHNLNMGRQLLASELAVSFEVLTPCLRSENFTLSASRT